MTDDATRALIAETARTAGARWRELLRWNVHDKSVNPHPGHIENFIANAVADALEAATAKAEAETEWEYGYRSRETGNLWGSGSLMDARLGAETIDAVIVRRRPASPWVPVAAKQAGDKP